MDREQWKLIHSYLHVAYGAIINGPDYYERDAELAELKDLIDEVYGRCK